MDIKNLGIELSQDTRYRNWLIECYSYAHNSRHPSTHNAALLIRDNSVVLAGVNNLPPGVIQKEERFEGENKHIYPNHAERDVLYKAARAGIATQSLIMVMPWLPCIPCANAIISCGISTLIVHKQMLERTKERWREELKEAVQLMKEAGIQVIAYDGITGVKAYMHRAEWEA